MVNGSASTLSTTFLAETKANVPIENSESSSVLTGGITATGYAIDFDLDVKCNGNINESDNMSRDLSMSTIVKQLSGDFKLIQVEGALDDRNETLRQRSKDDIDKRGKPLNHIILEEPESTMFSMQHTRHKNYSYSRKEIQTPSQIPYLLHLQIGFIDKKNKSETHDRWSLDYNVNIPNFSLRNLLHRSASTTI